MTITVDAAVIDAVDDGFGPVNGATGSANVGNAYANDTLNGVAVNPASITGTVLVPATPIGGAPVPVLDPVTGVVSVPAGTPAGSYTITYEICENLNPTNCDTATITVDVTAAPIVANPDVVTGVNGFTGAPGVVNVLSNDTLNGVPVSLATVVITTVVPATPIGGGPVPTLNPATGLVDVPAGTPAGVYTITYTICEQLNPTNCSTTTVTITVDAAVIDAVDDNYPAVDGLVGATTPSVLANDTLNGGPVTVGGGGNVTLTPGAAPTPVSGSITMNLDGTITVSAGTEAGTYTYPYTICEILNPTNCDSAVATVVVTAQPGLTVDKTAGAPSGSTAGSTIVYTFLVTNTGNVTVSGVTIVDPLLDAPAVCATTTLGIGASTTCTGTHTITQAEVDAGVVDNTATATGSLPGGGTTTSPPDSTSTPLTQSPALSLVKSSPTGSLTAGSTITYTVTATNSGNTTQTNVVVTDAMLTPNSATCASVAPGGTCVLTGTYVVQQSDVDAGQIVNTASVTSTSITTPVTATVTTPIARNPAITAVKTAVLTTDGGVAGAADVGDVITYNVTVTNSGNVTMTLQSVVDSLEGRTPTTLTCAPLLLAPGQSATCNSYTYTMQDGDITTVGPTLDNVVTATGLSAASSQSISSTSTAVVAVNGDPATVRIIKTATPRDVKVGDLVRYTLTLENTGATPVVDGTVIDTPPAGFNYVDGSLTVADADNTGRLVGTYPIRVDRIDIVGGGRATITYLLRVGAGVRAGIHTNTAVLEDNGSVVSNIATADVQLVGDPMLDESLIAGTVFHDRDGDGWQDPARLSGVRVQGGFAADAYVANSTTVDRGQGPTPEADASSPMLHGIDVGDISARQSEGDPVTGHRVTIRQTLRELRFTDDFVLTSTQGVTVRMAADGTTRVEKSGDAEKGLNGAAPTVERRVSQIADGYLVEYVIGNAGIDERGVPGVRLATVEGLLVETDQYGRYHLTGIDGGRWERGRNFILKVDPATLPPGTTFTTDNPLVRRVTPGVPVRFDFGVKMPEAVLEGGRKDVEMELGSVMFAPDSASIRDEYQPALDKMAETAARYRGGEVVIAAEGENDLLAFDRAVAVREALVKRLAPEVASALKISVRANPHDPSTTVVGVLEWPLIGTVLFETDRAEIKPQYLPLIGKIADYLQEIGTTQVAVVGHADLRGSDEYNTALGMRRAKAVYEAIANALPEGVRSRLRVDFNADPAAPAGKNDR